MRPAMENSVILGCNGENGRAYAEKLGLDHMTTWLDAAKQLNLPLYNVRGILDTVDDRYDGGMGMSAQLDTSAWPQVVLIELYGVETLPERIRLVETRSVTVE